ncbi:hypothetical protein [Ferruginibacter sp. SUN106]|uniref:hypothetical protein n=1 Tax=Ferruginibacter sp. SUN106 TaxID=2978348 RepID=UPI003D36A89F
MKNILLRLFFLLLLTVFYFTAAAQKKDTLYVTKKFKDSIFRVTHPGHYVADTAYPDGKMYMILKKNRHDSLNYKTDTLYFAEQKQFDSVHRKLNIARKKSTLYKDSTFKKFNLQFRSYDSVKRKTAFKRQQSDSVYNKKNLLFRSSDTLKRIHKLRGLQTDSLQKLYVLNGRLDTLHKFKVFRTVVADSLKKVLYLQHIKTDSLRMKKYLQLKKVQLLQIQQDTASVKNGYRSRELSMEITCNAGDTVYINNNYKKVIVKTIPSQKLRLSTIINYREALNERDDALLKKMGIELSRTRNSVTATVNGTRPPGIRDNNDNNGLNKANADNDICRQLNAESNVKRSLVIELPGNVIIVLNTRYADVNIENYVQNINAQITNGSLKMGNADNAVLKSKYSTIKTDDIKKADFNFTNTRFSGGNIMAMSIISKASSMELDHCTTMNIASVSDIYQVEKAGSISGNKDFGKLTIDNLKDQLILTGTNADVRINRVNFESPLIKIDSKYADLKVPVYDLKNYSISYEGSYKDVNKISAASQSVNYTGGTYAAVAGQQDTLAVKTNTGSSNKTKFNAFAGDITGMHTKVDIVCHFCNVSFK